MVNSACWRSEVMRSAPMPQPARPSVHDLDRAAAKSAAERLALAASSALTRRLEVGGGEVRERQAEVAGGALRVHQQCRDVVREALLDEVDPESGLAGTGHADNHAARRSARRMAVPFRGVTRM